MRSQWLTEQEELKEAYNDILEKEDIGFKDIVFAYNAKLSKEQFIKKMLHDAYQFLQPHRLR